MPNSQVLKNVFLTSIAGRDFCNPIWLGSGSLTESVGNVEKFLKTKIGAIVPRTTRWRYAPGRKKHPSFHLHFSSKEKWMRNSEWTGATIKYWLPYLKNLASTGKVVMSVSGRDISDCLKVCKIIDSFGFNLIEINISCAHSNEAHGFITRNSEHIKRLVSELKESVSTPIALKLGHSDFIVPLAKTAEEAGADAIVAINTYGPVLDFDIVKGKPKFVLGTANGKGGLSGRPIFHTALTDVFDLTRELKIPVIGCGGVSNYLDAVKMIMAGATAVQIYTAAHLAGNNAPKFINELHSDFEKWVIDNGYSSLSGFRGSAHRLVTKEPRTKILYPVYNCKKCVKCLACLKICLLQAIKSNKNGIILNKKLCRGCGACVSACGTAALS